MGRNRSDRKAIEARCTGCRDRRGERCDPEEDESESYRKGGTPWGAARSRLRPWSKKLMRNQA